MAGQCRECGCTEREACLLPRFGTDHVEESCSWAEPDLCTACSPGASDRWVHPAEQREMQNRPLLAIADAICERLERPLWAPEANPPSVCASIFGRRWYFHVTSGPRSVVHVVDPSSAETPAVHAHQAELALRDEPQLERQAA